MVNTFLIVADFTESARQLDSARLGKQRVEAFQLLKNLLLAEVISQILEKPLPTGSYKEKYQWLKDIHREYLQQSWSLQVNVSTTPYTVEKLPVKPKRIGYFVHPVTPLWLGYTSALTAYINAHITAWRERGKNNTMALYELPSFYERPSWCDDENFHLSHRRALLAKELGENRRSKPETPWYQLNPLFQNLKPIIEYNWTPGE